MFKQLILPLLLLLSSAFAQTTKTINFTVDPSACQNSVAPPRYFCLGYIASVENDEHQGEWSIYVDVVQPNGAITGGAVTLYTAFDDDVVNMASDMTYFDAKPISGTESNGVINVSAIGTMTGKHTGTFSATFSNLVIGSIPHGCYKKPHSNCPVPGIVSGQIHVLAQLTQ